ncbi:MAG: 4Fe-4S binding protein [Spirochaetaceae bacterium]|jgi:NAD-dependent dihydropyrimidine dehydrogenase PreA subunit|nr:4Fe-4S binding protein [Spirochaetaceae bacterium]
MLRKIIRIDESRCDGCGLCSAACHEEALAIVDGKAKLLRDDYCDGLGACLPACPAGAVLIEEREAAAFDESRAGGDKDNARSGEKRDGVRPHPNWPVQIRLVPAKAGFFDGAELLISADCAAYRYENFYRDFIKKSDGNSAGTKVTLIACPKLDNVDYGVKLSEIIRQNSVKAVTLVRMEVPCCGGLEWALSKAVGGAGEKSKKPGCRVVTLSVDGSILTREEI